MEGIPRTHQEALSLQKAGIFPDHVGKGLILIAALPPSGDLKSGCRIQALRLFVHVSVCVFSVSDAEGPGFSADGEEPWQKD